MPTSCTSNPSLTRGGCSFRAPAIRKVMLAFGLLQAVKRKTSSQVLLIMRVAVLGFFVYCAHELLPVTLEVKESAVCYQGLCVESSTSNLSRKKSMYVRSVEFKPIKAMLMYIRSVAVGSVLLDIALGAMHDPSDSQSPGLGNFGTWFLEVTLIQGSRIWVRSQSGSGP